MFDVKEYMREYGKKRRERLKAARLCFECEKPLSEGEVSRCSKCRAYHAAKAREWARARRKKSKEAGVCLSCGGPLLETGRFVKCAKCRAEHLEKYCRPRQGKKEGR